MKLSTFQILIEENLNYLSILYLLAVSYYIKYILNTIYMCTICLDTLQTISCSVLHLFTSLPSYLLVSLNTHDRFYAPPLVFTFCYHFTSLCSLKKIQVKESAKENHIQLRSRLLQIVIRNERECLIIVAQGLVIYDSAVGGGRI